MEKMKGVRGVRGMAPFSINPMMLTHGEATATGVLLKGVDPQASLGIGAPPGTVAVLDLPTHIKDGSIDQFRDLKSEVLLYPPQYKSGNIIYPYEKAKQ